jgi:cellulose biosynthesis protein BcsQ
MRNIACFAVLVLRVFATPPAEHKNLKSSIPQNVNYAVKSAFLMPFVENIPEIKQAGKAAYKDRAEIIEQMKKATVLVICY